MRKARRSRYRGSPTVISETALRPTARKRPARPGVLHSRGRPVPVPLPNRRDHHPARGGRTSADASGGCCGSGADGSGWLCTMGASGGASEAKLTFSRTVERRRTAFSDSRLIPGLNRRALHFRLRRGVLRLSFDVGRTGLRFRGDRYRIRSPRRLQRPPALREDRVASEIEPTTPASALPRRRRPPRRPRRRGRDSPSGD